MTAEVANLLAPLVKLLVIDAIIGLIAFLIIATLARSKRAAFAVLKRNFYGYFANPTGTFSVPVCAAHVDGRILAP